MIDLHFYEECQNSLDLLINFGQEKQHPEPHTIEECQIPQQTQAFICVTSQDPLINQPEHSFLDQVIQDGPIIQIIQARQEQQLKLVQLWRRLASFQSIQPQSQVQPKTNIKQRKMISKLKKR